MEKLNPLITTIIPTHGRAERLKRAIQSVLNQTYPHFQICIYDNASTDETRHVVSEFAKVDPRVKYHRHKRNIGAAENFQYGLSKVDTPFFSFLSDDDFLLPEFYETALNGFKKYPEAGFSSGAVIDMNERGEILDVILSKWPDAEYYSSPSGLLEMIGKYSNWVGTLFRQDVIAKVGDIDLKLKAIDIDYMFRAAALMPFALSKTPCAVFTQHSQSYSMNNGLKLICPGWQVMMSKIKENPNISLEIKKIAEQKLQIDYQNLLLLNALRGIERKKFDEAASIAEIFNQTSQKKIRKVMLSITIALCSSFSFAQRLFVVFLTIRRFFKRLRNIRKFPRLEKGLAQLIS